MLKLVMTQMGARLDKASAFAGTVLFGIGHSLAYILYVHTVHSGFACVKRFVRT
jgi:hypothetical protein